MLLPTVVYVVLLAHFAGVNILFPPPREVSVRHSEGAGVNVLFPRPLGERVRERGKYIVSFFQGR